MVRWSLVFGILGASIGLLAEEALAQSVIVPDETLGVERSLVAFRSASERITGGAIRGINLFHSFREFNVAEGRSTYFIAPNTGIENILARVTGKNSSEILGRLGTAQLVNGGGLGVSNANLFLINPNGIVFGQNASLDVDRSFVATTANALQFGNAGDFSASTPRTPSSLLTIQPSAFLFNQLPAGAISNGSTVDAGRDPSDSFNVFGLRVPDGRSLLLLGGNVTADRGGIVAFGGRIDLGGIVAVGTVGLNVNNNGLSLNFPDGLARADVLLTNGAGFLATTGGGGGDIAINARNINLSGESTIQAGIGRNLGTTNSQAGNITLDATGNLTVSESSEILNSISPGGNGNSGDINIRAESLLISNGAQIRAKILGKGNSGDINIGVNDLISIDGRDSLPTGRIPSAIFNSVEVDGEGDAGNISITAGSFKLTNRAQILSNTEGKGNAGNISISAQKEALLLNSIIISEVTESLGEGNGGDINITADSLVLRNGSSLLADTENFGNAGNITIVAPTAVTLEGEGPPAMLSDSVTAIPSQISSTVEFKLDAERSRQGGNISISTKMLSIKDAGFITTQTEDKGDAGDISFQVGTLSITDGGSVNTNTLGEGDAGNITIRASESVELSGDSGEDGSPGGILAQVERNGKGRAGDIFLETNRLSISDGSKIQAATFGDGDAGTLFIRADEIELFNSPNATNFFSTAINAGVTRDPRFTKQATGNGGKLTIEARQLSIRDGAEVTVDTFGKGNAGSLFVRATDLVEVVGSGRGISANVQQDAEGQGGNITVETNRLSLRDGGRLGASTLGRGNAGDINVRAKDSVEVVGVNENGSISRIVAVATDTATGNGGTITIKTGELSIGEGGRVAVATSGKGNAGAIQIYADSIGITGKSGDSTVNSQISAAVDPDSTGRGGSINLEARKLAVQSGGLITSRSEGSQRAGDININLQETLQARNSEVSTNSNLSGGGSITITAQGILLRDNSNIRTTSDASNGGNITLNAKTVVALEDSNILAFAPVGEGGQISFVNNRAFLSDPLYRPASPITERAALNALQTNGRVDVNASGAVSGAISGVPDISFIQNSLNQLPNNQIDTNKLLAQTCIIRKDQPEGTFYVTGSGSIPNRPNDPALSDYPTNTIQPTTQTAQRPWKLGDPIIEPQGFYKLADGRFVMSRECASS
jgi:filamentous hemagglutinin family protein